MSSTFSGSTGDADDVPRRSRLTLVVVVLGLAAVALAALRDAFPPRLESIQRIEASLGEEVAFETAADGSRELRLAAPLPPDSDAIARAAAALVTAPRLVMRADGRYGLRVARVPVAATQLLAPGTVLAETALVALHGRIDAQAAECASRLVTLAPGEVVFVDSRSSRIPLALTAVPDLRRVEGPGLLMEALRRTLERLETAAAPPSDAAPGSAPAAPGSAESRADAVARAARERASAWAEDGAASLSGRAELAAFADRVAAFAAEIAPGGPETRRLLKTVARDALARFVQQAGPASVSPSVRAAALLLLGAIGGAIVAALRSGVSGGVSRPVLGGAFFAWLAVGLFEWRGILPTAASDPFGRWLYAAEMAAIAFGFAGGFLLDGRIEPRAEPRSADGARTEGREKT